MKFSLLLIVPLLANLSHYASIVDSKTTTDTYSVYTESMMTTNNTKNNTIVTTSSSMFPVITCYQKEFTFKNLDPQDFIQKIIEDINKNDDILSKFTFKRDQVFCGLLISKNHKLNNYNFKYDFFNNTECREKRDTICDSGSNCTEAAIKCCKGGALFPCNFYVITPALNTTCLHDNSTNCFQITSGGELPTPENEATAITTKNYLTILQSLITAFFITAIKNIN